MAMPQNSEADDSKNDCNTVCPHVYFPICATDGNATKVFTSACGMLRAGCIENKGEHFAKFRQSIFWKENKNLTQFKWIFPISINL